MKFDIWVLIKGMMMGAADIVPGVSGGTIAFITGIYERLLLALKAILPGFFSLLKHKSIRAFWSEIDGGFLLTLFCGIVVSALSLAKLIVFLLAEYPIPLWAGFFGLILASVWVVSRDIDGWNIQTVLCLIVGIGFAYGVTEATPTSIELNLVNIFLSGLLAICAMVLPGISGSFILVILGTYGHVLSAIKAFDVEIMLVFMSGCLVGILSIANVLAWAYARYKQLTLSLLTGFMIGALNKVWPWKEVLTYRTNRHGEQVPLQEQNILPSEYEILMSESSMLLPAIVSGLVAAVFVLGISKLSSNKS